MIPRQCLARGIQALQMEPGDREAYHADRRSPGRRSRSPGELRWQDHPLQLLQGGNRGVPPVRETSRQEAWEGRIVNALPPLKVVQLLGNACLSPTTLAPKGPFRPRGPKWILWFSLDSVEPHRVTSNDLVGALGAIPAAWWRTSHDVLARLMFSSRADSFSPANRLHPHYQRANSIVPGAGSLSRIVYNNYHSFTYAASVP